MKTLLAFLPASLMLILGIPRTTFADQIQMSFAPAVVRSAGPGNIRVYAEPANIDVGPRVYIDIFETMPGGIVLIDGNQPGETLILHADQVGKLRGAAGGRGFRNWPPFTELFGATERTGSGLCLLVSDVQVAGCSAPVQAPPADFNLDGSVSVQDIFDFLASWMGLHTGADLDSDSQITFSDLNTFFAEYFSAL